MKRPNLSLLFSRAPRMSDWLAAAVLLAGVIWLIAPQQLPVSVYKLSLVAMAAVVGYWIDRSLFPYARPDALLAMPDEAEPTASAASPAADDTGGECSLHAMPDEALLRLMGVCMLRRALIVAAVVVAVSLGA